MNIEPFNPAAWAVRHLDLLHPPQPERDTPLLTALSVVELTQLYHTLSTIPAAPDWQDFAWDTFADLVERELALEG